MRMRVAEDGTVTVTAPYGVPVVVIEQFVQGRSDWVEAQRAKLENTIQAHAANATKAEQAEWRKAVELSVTFLLEKWEPVIGVRHRKLSFRNMKSRWWSCQPQTGRICINTRLALFPPRCLEYVVVHELCHMRVANHGPAFKALLDAYLPDWRESERLLRTYRLQG